MSFLSKKKPEYQVMMIKTTGGDDVIGSVRLDTVLSREVVVRRPLKVYHMLMTTGEFGVRLVDWVIHADVDEVAIASRHLLCLPVPVNGYLTKEYAKFVLFQQARAEMEQMNELAAKKTKTEPLRYHANTSASIN